MLLAVCLAVMLAWCLFGFACATRLLFVLVLTVYCCLFVWLFCCVWCFTRLDDSYYGFGLLAWFGYALVVLGLVIGLAMLL